MRVVLVDDDKDTLAIFSDYLELHGIDVVGKGYNGKQGYEIYRLLKPDVIIIDLKMPQYDGRYAIEMIKKEDPCAKIIVTTGYPDYEFNSEKVAGFFYKPYNVEKLITLLGKIAENNFGDSHLQENPEN